MRVGRSNALMTLTLCVALTWLAGSVRAQDSYPSKPIHFIVTTAAGGAGDGFGFEVPMTNAPHN
jgi:tripartite-type tricarboxylate transporter receptor subunit TctC